MLDPVNLEIRMRRSVSINSHDKALLRNNKTLMIQINTLSRAGLQYTVQFDCIQLE